VVQIADDVLSTLIRQQTSTKVVTVERGQLARFAHAVKDRNPVTRDATAAAEAGFSAIPAPPTYPFAMGNFGVYPELQPGPSRSDPMPAALGPVTGTDGLILHGEQEFIYQRPVVAGDVLVGEGQVVDVYQKESKGRTMTFVVVETVWREHSTGDVVCTARMNLIHRP
jgi:acyl dehydratase